VAFVVGGILTGGGLLAIFAAMGIVDDMLVVAQSTSAYNAQYTDWGAFLSQIGAYFGFRWAYWSPVFVLTGAAFVLSVVGKLRGRWLLAWVWLIAGIAFMMIQRLGFDTHWIPMLPALALLSGAAIDSILTSSPALLHLGEGRQTRLSENSTTVPLQSASSGNAINAPLQSASSGNPINAPLHSGEGWGVRFLAIFFLAILAYNTWLPALPYLLGREDQVAYYGRFQANDLKPEQGLQVVNYLRERVQAGDTIFIWGFRPEVAFMGGWRPATRWQAQFPLVATWYPREWQQQNVDTLWAALPPYALILRDDYMPWVTGQNADSFTILQSYTELNNWFTANYEIVETIGDFLICQRKPRT
jgi:hypothetical protein